MRLLKIKLHLYIAALLPSFVQAKDLVGTGGPDWSTRGTDWFKSALDWGTGPGLDIVIIAGILGGLLAWNLAPKSGGLGIAVKGVASALFAIPIIAGVLAIKHGF